MGASLFSGVIRIGAVLRCALREQLLRRPQLHLCATGKRDLHRAIMRDDGSADLGERGSAAATPPI